MRALASSFANRKQRKRYEISMDCRINAAARMNDLSYSRLMRSLKLANVEIMKVLSEMAINDQKLGAYIAKSKLA